MTSAILGAFTQLIGGSGGSGGRIPDLPASFNYTFGNKVQLPYASVFQLFDGRQVSDNRPVSIFMYDKKGIGESGGSGSPLALDYARNCLKYLRTLRHPCILASLNAVEVPSGIYIVTEHVRPLVSSHFPSDPVWGLHRIASAIAFLQNDAKLVHGLICPYSVYCPTGDGGRSGGSWVLGAFDCTMEITGALGTLKHKVEAHPLRESGLRPPLNALQGICGVDLWGLSCLLCWAYAAAKISPAGLEALAEEPSSLLDHPNLLRLGPESHHGAIPSNVEKIAKVWIKKSENLKKPLDIKRLKEQTSIMAESPLIYTMSFLEEINLKGHWEKEHFFSKFAEEVLPTIPPSLQVTHILPHLRSQLNLFLKESQQQSLSNLILQSILEIGSNLLSVSREPKSASVVLYQSDIIPILVQAYQKPDRSMRYMLLQDAERSIPLFSRQQIETIAEPVILGLTDSAPLLRLQTIKSLKWIAPHLRGSRGKCLDKIQSLLSHIAQSDPDCAMRMSALVCLDGLSACKTFASNHAFLKSLLKNLAVTRGFSEQENQCKMIAIECTLNSCFDAKEIVTSLLPHLISSGCTDGVLEVRAKAFQAAQRLLRRAEEVMVETSRNGEQRREDQLEGRESNAIPLVSDLKNYFAATGSILGFTMKSDKETDSNLTTPVKTRVALPPPSELFSKESMELQPPPPTTSSSSAVAPYQGSLAGQLIDDYFDDMASKGTESSSNEAFWDVSTEQQAPAAPPPVPSPSPTPQFPFSPPPHIPAPRVSNVTPPSPPSPPVPTDRIADEFWQSFDRPVKSQAAASSSPPLFVSKDSSAVTDLLSSFSPPESKESSSAASARAKSLKEILASRKKKKGNLSGKDNVANDELLL